MHIKWLPPFPLFYSVLLSTQHRCKPMAQGRQLTDCISLLLSICRWQELVLNPGQIRKAGLLGRRIWPLVSQRFSGQVLTLEITFGLLS